MSYKCRSLISQCNFAVPGHACILHPSCLPTLPQQLSSSASAMWGSFLHFLATLQPFSLLLWRTNDNLLLAATSFVLIGCPTFFLHHLDCLILKGHRWPIISQGFRRTAFILLLLYCVFKQSHGLSWLLRNSFHLHFWLTHKLKIFSWDQYDHFVKQRKFIGFWSLKITFLKYAFEIFSLWNSFEKWRQSPSESCIPFSEIKKKKIHNLSCSKNAYLSVFCNFLLRKGETHLMTFSPHISESVLLTYPSTQV